MRKQGVVKWFNNEKGYGFIQGDDGKDVFVHYKAIKTQGYKSLMEGDKVTYDVVPGKKGMQAEEVERLNS